MPEAINFKGAPAKSLYFSPLLRGHSFTLFSRLAVPYSVLVSGLNDCRYPCGHSAHMHNQRVIRKPDRKEEPRCAYDFDHVSWSQKDGGRN